MFDSHVLRDGVLPLLQECQQLGIDSSDIRGGLLGLTSELPALAGAAVELLQAQELTADIDYYSAVTGYQQGDAAAADGAGELLPVLSEVREGTTEAPGAAAGPAASGSGNDSSSATGLQVDWDLGAALEAVDGGEADAGAAGISWDLGAVELATAGGDGGEPAAAGGISWDFDVEAEPAAAGGADEAPAGGDGAPVEMSWDIDISGLGEAAEQQQGQHGGGASSTAPAAAAAGAAGAAAEDEPATVRRLVEDGAYRASLLDDLFELRAFLAQVGAGRVRLCTVVLCRGASTVPQHSLGVQDAAPQSCQLPAAAPLAYVAKHAGLPLHARARQPATPACPCCCCCRRPCSCLQRCRELSSKSAELLVAGASQAVQHVDADVAGGMLGAVNAALAAFSGERGRQRVWCGALPNELLLEQCMLSGSSS